MNGQPVLVGTDLYQTYPAASGSVLALRGVEITVERGALTVVAGPSGSGKSTLLRILAAIDVPQAGRVVVEGIDLVGSPPWKRRRIQRRRLAYVFQDPVQNLFDYLDAAGHLALWRRLRRLRPEPAGPWLDAVGLGGRERSLPEQLSGGEQQRLAFAAAAASEPAVVLADEPTSQLDPRSVPLMVESMAQLKGLGTTFVLTSHDPAVLRCADVVVPLDHGARV